MITTSPKAEMVNMNMTMKNTAFLRTWLGRASSSGMIWKPPEAVVVVGGIAKKDSKLFRWGNAMCVHALAHIPCKGINCV